MGLNLEKTLSGTYNTGLDLSWASRIFRVREKYGWPTRLVWTSTVAAERVFSMLANSFSSRQESSLEDYVTIQR